MLSALSGKGRDKANGCGAASGYTLAIAVVLEPVGVARETVEVEHNRRLGGIPRADHIEVDRVVRAPLYLEQFPDKGLGFSLAARHRWTSMQTTVVQGKRRETFGCTSKSHSFAGRIRNQLRTRRGLLGGRRCMKNGQAYKHKANRGEWKSANHQEFPSWQSQFCGLNLVSHPRMYAYRGVAPNADHWLMKSSLSSNPRTSCNQACGSELLFEVDLLVPTSVGDEVKF